MDLTTNSATDAHLCTVKQIANHPAFPWLTESALRHMIFNAEPRKSSKGDVVPGNGMQEAGCLIRLGRKLLIDMDRFRLWLDTHRVGGA